MDQCIQIMHVMKTNVVTVDPDAEEQEDRGKPRVLDQPPIRLLHGVLHEAIADKAPVDERELPFGGTAGQSGRRQQP